MKLFTTALLAATITTGAAAAQTQTPPAHTPTTDSAAPAQPPQSVEAAAAKPSVETTPMDELLQDEKAMAVLYKHFPEMQGQEDQLAMAGSMTLRDIQAFAADVFTDEKLAAVEVDFRAIE